MSRVLVGVAGETAVRIIAVDATEIARETARVHGLAVGAATLGAEATVAAGLMSAHIKGEDRITLQVQSEVPRASLFAEIDGLGAVRGRVMPPALRFAGGARLDGILVAIRSNATREVYRGTTQVKGSMQSALEEHLEVSAQVDAIIRIAVDVDADGIVFAGGFLFERMPSHPELPSLTSKQFYEAFGGLRDASVHGVLDGLVAGQVLGISASVLGQRDLRWQCRCSRDKVLQTLAALGPTTLAQLLEEDGGAEVVCHFCLRAEQIDGDTLARLIAANAPMGES